MVFALTVLTGCEQLAGPAGACLAPTPIESTASVNGIAYTDDCEGPEGSLGDIYYFTLTEQKQILITLAPTGFKGQVVLGSGNFGDLGGRRLVFDVIGDGTIGAKAFLPPGNYFIVAGSAENSGGDYTLTLAPTTSSPCSDQYLNYTVRGADIPGVILLDDCAAGAASIRQEAYGLWLAPNEAITVSIDMNKNGGLLWRRSGNAAGASLAELNIVANTTLTTNFIAPDGNDPFGIHVNSTPGLTGAATYTLRIR